MGELEFGSVLDPGELLQAIAVLLALVAGFPRFVAEIDRKDDVNHLGWMIPPCLLLIAAFVATRFSTEWGFWLAAVALAILLVYLAVFAFQHWRTKRDAEEAAGFIQESPGGGDGGPTITIRPEEPLETYPVVIADVEEYAEPLTKRAPAHGEYRPRKYRP